MMAPRATSSVEKEARGRGGERESGRGKSTGFFLPLSPSPRLPLVPLLAGQELAKFLACRLLGGLIFRP